MPLLFFLFFLTFSFCLFFHRALPLYRYAAMSMGVYYPGVKLLRVPMKYTKRTRASDHQSLDCSKGSHKHKELTPGTFCWTCPHGIALGYVHACMCIHAHSSIIHQLNVCVCEQSSSYCLKLHVYMQFPHDASTGERGDGHVHSHDVP